MDHIVYCIELMGIDYVGIGPDTLFGDHVGLHNAFASHLSIKRSGDYPLVEYVKGLENPAECFPNITRWLVKNGYSDQDIKKLLGENALRVLKATWGDR